MVEIDANDPNTLNGPDALDPTTWGLHGAAHRALPLARCVMHVHSVDATVLASLAVSRKPPIPPAQGQLRKPDLRPRRRHLGILMHLDQTDV